MTAHPHWRDVEGAVARLTDGERRALLLVARLPLLWEGAIERLYGLRGGASVYRCLARLRAAALIDDICPALRPGRNPRLLYLTDLGIATVALDQRVDPEHLARRARLRGPDLLARIPDLPHLLATYQLLAALAGCRSGQRDLLAWEQPWRRVSHPSGRTPIPVRLPAYVALSWDGEAAAHFLLPDLATFPLRVHRRTLTELVALRGDGGEAFPTLVVATTEARHAAWTRLLDEVGRIRAAPPLMVRVVTWRELRDDPAVLRSASDLGQSSVESLVRRPRLRRLDPRQPASPIPRPVGATLGPCSSADGMGHRALDLTAADRDLLDLVGRHPFLQVADIATALGWAHYRARERRDRLVAAGLLRLLGSEEVGAEMAADLAELTPDGLELAAAQQGLALGLAVRHNGLAGGEPDRPSGARTILVRNLEHTRGVNGIFVGLFGTAAARAAAGHDDALLEWRNAAACSRRRVRPDGYGMYRCDGRLHGFFLEYDRGTMNARDYREKWAAYYDYRDSRAFEREYDGFPTILVVTIGNAAEERIARAARAVAAGRLSPLPLLLTCEWRLTTAPADSHGMLGPIWREPAAPFAERRPWPR